MSAEHTFSMSGCHNNKSFVRVSLCYERSSSIPRQFGVFSNLWDFWWQHLAFVKCAIVVSICDGCTDDDTRHMNSSYRRIDCPDAYNFGWLAGWLSVGRGVQWLGCARMARMVCSIKHSVKLNQLNGAQEKLSTALESCSVNLRCFGAVLLHGNYINVWLGTRSYAKKLRAIHRTPFRTHDSAIRPDHLAA